MKSFISVAIFLLSVSAFAEDYYSLRQNFDTSITDFKLKLDQADTIKFRQPPAEMRRVSSQECHKIMNSIHSHFYSWFNLWDEPGYPRFCSQNYIDHTFWKDLNEVNQFGHLITGVLVNYTNSIYVTKDFYPVEFHRRSGSSPLDTYSALVDVEGNYYGYSSLVPSYGDGRRQYFAEFSGNDGSINLRRTGGDRLRQGNVHYNYSLSLSKGWQVYVNSVLGRAYYYLPDLYYSYFVKPQDRLDLLTQEQNGQEVDNRSMILVYENGKIATIYNHP